MNQSARWYSMLVQVNTVKLKVTFLAGAKLVEDK